MATARSGLALHGLPARPYGVATIDQWLPFQCSASVASRVPNVLFDFQPTAQQFAGPVHDRPPSCASPARAGFGLRTRVHFDRRSRRMNVLTTLPVP